MAYYRKCPRCGDNLDPGERCECAQKQMEAENQESEYEKKEKKYVYKTA